MPDVTETTVAQVFRTEYGRAVSVLVRVLGDLDLAEDAVQEAFTLAVHKWADAGIPPSPAGWIITTARNRAIDRLRREAIGMDRHADAALVSGHPDGTQDAAEVTVMQALEQEDSAVPDDRLRLIFTCCHPALAIEARIALTLRLLGGLSTPEIAAAFLVPEPTMAQRLVRAKAKIKKARIPYRIPAASELPDRVPAVLSVVYLIFNEGYTASSGAQLTRDDLAAEAIRLGRALVELMPDEPEAAGLLALMLLNRSREAARTAADGSLVLLADQDRSRWDAALIAEGQALVRDCLRRHRPGPYQIQSAIAAVHSDASSADRTDWHQILALYDQLMALASSPVVALNRAVAVAELSGPAAGLDLVDGLSLDGYYLWHAVRADLLRRLGRTGDAIDAYGAAAALAASEPERNFLQTRRIALTESSE